jgi:DNA-binding response OmpR family regulator
MSTRRDYWVSRSHRFGSYEFRPSTGEVVAQNDVTTFLTESEAETLHLLIVAYPLPVPRSRIIQEMRRIECYGHVDTTEVVVARLRRKLGSAIISTHPRGYQFNAEHSVAGTAQA